MEIEVIFTCPKCGILTGTANVTTSIPLSSLTVAEIVAKAHAREHEEIDA